MLLLFSLLVSLSNGVLQSSLLVSLQSTSVLASPLTSLWKIFLQRLYKDISTIIHTQVKPETHSYNYLYKDISTITPIHIKPEITRSWIPSHSSLQPYMKYFHKLITYYMTDYNHSINTGNIRRQVVGYIMSLKRKIRMKLKGYSPEEDKYHFMFNNVLPSDSDLLRNNTHKGCCIMNANKYNYKLRSVIGREDEYEVTKWTWFNKQVYDMFLCS